MAIETGATRTAGRKRDPAIESRATAAAIEVYAEFGWQGFTFDAVARTSGVGKPAIYRRWDSREALLVDAFDRVSLPTARDLGSLRADLEDYVAQWVDWYHKPHLPQAGSRVLIDGASNAELNRLYSEVLITPRGRAVREVTRRAIARGEVPAGTPPTLLPDIVIGSFSTHWAYTPDKTAQSYFDSIEAYGARLVETIIAGLSHS